MALLTLNPIVSNYNATLPSIRMHSAINFNTTKINIYSYLTSQLFSHVLNNKQRNDNICILMFEVRIRDTRCETFSNARPGPRAPRNMEPKIGGCC